VKLNQPTGQLNRRVFYDLKDKRGVLAVANTPKFRVAAVEEVVSARPSGPSLDTPSSGSLLEPDLQSSNRWTASVR
jgi:hypothetical protein